METVDLHRGSIDFIFENNKGICLLEEKTINGKMSASRSVMEGKTPYKADICYKVIRNNFGKGNFYVSVPHYGVSFILNNISDNFKQGIKMEHLEYPK